MSSLLVTLINIYYNKSNLNNKLIKNIDLKNCIELLESDIHFRKLTIILLITIKIYNYKTNLLNKEIQQFIKTLEIHKIKKNKKINKTNRNIDILLSDIIMNNIENNTIQNNVIEAVRENNESILLDNNVNVVINNNESNLFDNDESLNQPIQLPDCGFVSNDECEIIDENNQQVANKTKRTIIDSKSEYSLTEYLKINKNKKIKLDENVNEMFVLPDELKNYIENYKIEEREVEMVRNSSILDVMYDYNDFDMEDKVDENYQLVSEEEHYSFEFPNIFKFNEYVGGMDRNRKVNVFYELLKMAQSGEVIANQEVEYGEIYCERNIKY